MIRITLLFFLIFTFSSCQSFDFSKLSCKEVRDMFGRLSVEVSLKPHCDNDADCQLLGSKGNCQCLQRMRSVLTVSAFPKSSSELQTLHDRFFSDACSNERTCAYNRSVGPGGYKATCTNGNCLAIPKNEDICN